MDTKSKTLIIIFTLLLTASVVATFHRYIMLEDISYEIDEVAFQEALLEE